MMRKIQSLQEVVLGKLVSYIQNNEVRMCSNSICKHTHTHTHTTLKKNQRSKYKTRNHKKPRRKQGGMLFDINYIILDLSPKAKETKSKVNK